MLLLQNRQDPKNLTHYDTVRFPLLQSKMEALLLVQRACSLTLRPGGGIHHRHLML